MSSVTLFFGEDRLDWIAALFLSPRAVVEWLGRTGDETRRIYRDLDMAEVVHFCRG